MINKIEIKGFKSIKELDLNLKPINVLIGSNGVGKSNFISFFKLVNNIYEQRLENYSIKRGAENLLHFGRKESKEISGYLEFDYKNAYGFNLEGTDNNTLFLNEEITYFNKSKGGLTDFYGGGWSWNVINSNSKESVLKNNNKGISYYVNNYIRNFKIYHFHDTSDTSALRTPAMLNDNISLREDAGNLAAYLYLLQEKQTKYFKRIEHTIKSIAPYFEKFELQPDRLNEERINLEWREINHPDTPFNANHFSDGTIRFIALTALLTQPNLPEVIIIDEPELGLHPVAINKLAGLIKKASVKCQIIISTQSVNLVSNFDPEDIITVDRFNNQSVFNRLEDKDLNKWLNDFSLGELWLKNIIKGQPY
ncbi:putative ATPase [Mesonia algae]|uniref:Putative ATPase n=1 Tax=Mesonia algae TaxID=213248 RepID=A0A2W7I1J7_9FLAO|nr:AAA family ATPase [Mesonia algae]PZW40614.1 putative ATPase [Mesonia algae]